MLEFSQGSVPRMRPLNGPHETGHLIAHAQVKALLEERDALKAEIARLRALMAPASEMPRHWKLSRQEQTLLATLSSASPAVVSRERIVEALYGDKRKGGELATIRVVINHIRHKLTAVGFPVTIESHHAMGWRICTRDRDRIAEAIEIERARRDPPDIAA